MGDHWEVRCGDREASGPLLADVMAEATGRGEGEPVPLVPGVHAIDAWLRDHARAIEAELAASEPRAS